MEEFVIVIDQETGERLEMSKIAFQSLIYYDDKGRYVVLN